MRWVAVAAAVLASGAWGLCAFILAAYEHIEGSDDAGLITADIALATIGIGCLLLAVRGRLGDRTESLTLPLICAGAALVAWLAVAVSMAP